MRPEIVSSRGKRFADTIFYQVQLTAKYTKMLGIQLFGKLGVGLTIEEFSILDTISAHPDLCQRDLAKIILRDRANTGKLLDSLEAKGLIERELSVKNNRPVKIIKTTKSGEKMYNDIYTKLAPHHKYVEEKIENTDLAKMGELLKDLREILEDTIEIGI
jgi:DNA-binding MarR family transcriptional regulator